MLDSLRALATLSIRSNKKWLLPFILFLIVASLGVVSAQLSPVPIFLYPMI